jgi:hypothetical protein
MDEEGALKLRVTLVGAQYLPVLNANGRSDPYAEVTATVAGLGKWLERTQVARNTVHPRWDAQVEKSLAGCELGPADELHVRVLNRDRLWRDAELGHCALSLRKVWGMADHRMATSPVPLQRRVSRAQLSKPSILIGRLAGNFDAASGQFRVAASPGAPAHEPQLVVGVEIVVPKPTPEQIAVKEREAEEARAREEFERRVQFPMPDADLGPNDAAPDDAVEIAEDLSHYRPAHVVHSAIPSLQISGLHGVELAADEKPMLEDEVAGLVAHVANAFAALQSGSSVRLVEYCPSPRSMDILLGGTTESGEAVTLRLRLIVHPDYPRGRCNLLLRSCDGVAKDDRRVVDFMAVVNGTLHTRLIGMHDFVVHCDIHFGSIFAIADSAARPSGDAPTQNHQATVAELRASIRQSARKRDAQNIAAASAAGYLLRSIRNTSSALGGAPEESTGHVNAMRLLRESLRSDAGTITAMEFVPVDVRAGSADRAESPGDDGSDDDECDDTLAGLKDCADIAGALPSPFARCCEAESAHQPQSDIEFMIKDTPLMSESAEPQAELDGLVVESELVEEAEPAVLEEEDSEMADEFVHETYSVSTNWESNILDTTFQQHVKQLQMLFGMQSVECWPNIHKVCLYVPVSFFTDQQATALGLTRSIPVAFTILFPRTYLESPTSPTVLSVAQGDCAIQLMQHSFENAAKNFLVSNWRRRARRPAVAIGVQPVSRRLAEVRATDLPRLLQRGFDPLSAVEALEATGSVRQALRRLMHDGVSTDGLLEDEDVRANFILWLYINLVDHVRKCMMLCVVCGAPLPTNGVRPGPCTLSKCRWDFQSLGLGSFVASELTSNPDQAEMLLLTLSSAARSSHRDDVLSPFPPMFLFVRGGDNDSGENDVGHNWESLHECLAGMPSITEMIAAAGDGEQSLRGLLAQRHPEAYSLLRWLHATARLYVTGISPQQRVAAFETLDQYVLLSAPPARLARFSALRQTFGSFFAFRNSCLGKFHAVMSVGLRSAADAGVSLSISMGGPCSAALDCDCGWLANRFGDRPLRCVAVCEVIDHPSLAGRADAAFLVRNEDLVVPRFLLVYAGDQHVPMLVDNDELRGQLHVLLGYRPDRQTLERQKAHQSGPSGIHPNMLSTAQLSQRRSLRETRSR